MSSSSSKAVVIRQGGALSVSEAADSSVLDRMSSEVLATVRSAGLSPVFRLLVCGIEGGNLPLLKECWCAISTKYFGMPLHLTDKTDRPIRAVIGEMEDAKFDLVIIINVKTWFEDFALLEQLNVKAKHCLIAMSGHPDFNATLGLKWRIPTLTMPTSFRYQELLFQKIIGDRGNISSPPCFMVLVCGAIYPELIEFLDCFLGEALSGLVSDKVLIHFMSSNNDQYVANEASAWQYDLIFAANYGYFGDPCAVLNTISEHCLKPIVAMGALRDQNKGSRFLTKVPILEMPLSMETLKETLKSILR